MDVATSQVVPSMLDADQSRLGEELADLERSGADRVQWDVMDGSFVPRITHGPDPIAAVRKQSLLPFEAHLMIDRPEQHWRAFRDAGCEVVIVHAEATRHLHILLGDIRESGARAGVALNPATPLDAVASIIDSIDHLLVMTVNPGRGGQRFIAEMLPKIRAARALVEERGLPIDIEVDGGISAATAPQVAQAGANLLVAGSAVQRHPDGRARAIDEIRMEAQRGGHRRQKLIDEADGSRGKTDPEDLRRGVELFNAGQFWESHEAWESAWKPVRHEPGADFYKGLVQVAAGCYHYQRRNREGAVAKWRNGAGLLRPYLPARDGLALEPLVREVDALREKLERGGEWPELAMPQVGAA